MVLIATAGDAMRVAYKVWLDEIETSGRTPDLSSYLLWEAWDDNLPYRLGTPHLVNLLDQATEELSEQRLALTRVRHILSSGYACHGCFTDDLRRAVGMDPAPTRHEEHP